MQLNRLAAQSIAFFFRDDNLGKFSVDNGKKIHSFLPIYCSLLPTPYSLLPTPCSLLPIIKLLTQFKPDIL
ncbi:hypothetical protein [Moorena sp. SIO3H5]|uniref:hypothetical protein n=1 Tax=Moorena sp. SIO3H5 TaxID=2607834 RepID=UPI0025DD2CB7|nr:hypothetical protein [Moorena sp. SIO3H5]